MRLFFVAITRAKSHLTLTNSVKGFGAKAPPRLEYLDEVEKDGVINSPYIGTVKTHYDDLPAVRAATDLHSGWLAAYTRLTPELLPILKKRLEKYRLTATDLTTFIDIVYAGPLEFYKRKVLRAPAEPSDNTLHLGNLLHATFEAITRDHLTDAAAAEFYESALKSLSLLRDDELYLLDKGLHALSVDLPVFGATLRAPGARAEVDFSPDHLEVYGVPITGKIDHLHIDDDKKTIDIYDFKTGKHHASKWDKNATLYKYSLQLEFYKLLVENSPAYQKYRVNSAHILFVSPDADDQVYDKLYEYTPASAAAFRDLLTAVYAHIKALDFLDDSPLARLPDDQLKLKDIQEFISTIIDLKPEN